MDDIRGYEYMKAPIEAVNFGGGTPTALRPRQMDKVLKAVRSRFSLSKGCEISVESSISELTDEMLSVLIENGVNRLSIGVQTFDDNTRKLLNRRGTGENAARRLRDVIASGITNTGIDLIYNYPNQTIEHLQRDLSIIKELNLAGISFYSLMLHEHTPLFRMLSQEEKDKMKDLAREYEFFRTILNELQPHGYKVFELTKLIRDGLDRYDYIRIRHARGSCIAVGHGAGGNIDSYVYQNSESAPNVSDAVKISSRGRVVSDEYFIIDQLIGDLQKTSVSLKTYSELLDVELEKLFEPAIDSLWAEGYVVQRAGCVELTPKGLFWGNNIIGELIHILLRDYESRLRNRHKNPHETLPT